MCIRDSIWYRYTASCTGQATFYFCSSSYDTRVAAYTIGENCVGSLLECNDDFCGSQSEMTFNVVAGEEYLIRVGGYNDSGIGVMNVTCADADCEAFVEIVDGVMLINATGGSDDITVTQTANMVTVNVNNACRESYSLRDIDQIVVNAFGGSDFIQIDAFVNTIVHGGNGADVILGGSLGGELFGGPGPDTILGGPADDLIDAGFGTDTVFGFAGNDELLGGPGVDTLDGGAGDDELFGGLGGDSLSGGSGSDLLVGNVGADFLSGGGGDDKLMGLGGPDELLGGSGNDDLQGGAGFDMLNGGGGNDTSLDNGEVEIQIEN